jgi:hypothetical protein
MTTTDDNDQGQPAPGSRPCPCCDAAQMPPLVALAMGAALGVAFQDLHALTDRMCVEHRQVWVMAMLNADVLIHSVDGDGGEPFDTEDQVNEPA